MNKADLLRAILAQLDRELEAYATSARAAHAEATHEQSKAENKYDTRGLEASYLAHGQSRLAAETQEARHAFAALEVRKFAADEAVDLGALVTVEAEQETDYYFIGPRAGGTEITLGRKQILVLTPQSPLGALLQGQRAGSTVQLQRGGKALKYRVVAVS